MATTFEDKVKDKRGKVYFNTLSADSPDAAKQKMKGGGYTVVGIKEKGGAKAAGAAGGGDMMAKLNEMMEVIAGKIEKIATPA